MDANSLNLGNRHQLETKVARDWISKGEWYPIAIVVVMSLPSGQCSGIGSGRL